MPLGGCWSRRRGQGGCAAGGRSVRRDRRPRDV